jgi:O-acetylhomoserine (thiol)-lyase
MQFETLAVHGGYTPEPTTHSVAVPLYQTVAYSFDSAQHGADLFDLKVPGNIYTRIMNPTTDVLEKRVAALEGGVAALAMASGMAAITAAIQTIAETGDNIISASTLYGGTYNLFAHTFPQQGIEVRFADPRDPASFAKLIDARTKAVYCESIGNPLGNVTDIAALAKVAHDHGVPLIVDNTVPSPYLCRPIEHGADIVVHALTKYMNGHGNSIGGIIVDSGKFPWAQHKERFKRLNEPDVSYHGVVYTEALGPAAFIGRARVVPLRNMGAALSPFNAWLTLQGIETLPLRMDRICDNTLALAKTLQAHPKVEWVRYAGLPDHADPRRGAAPDGWPCLGHPVLRPQEQRRRPARCRRPLPRRIATVHAPGQHRRCQVAGHAPGIDHAPPAQPRRTGQGRCERKHGAPVGGHRAPARPAGRPGPGAGQGLSLALPPGACTGPGDFGCFWPPAPIHQAQTAIVLIAYSTVRPSARAYP